MFNNRQQNNSGNINITTNLMTSFSATSKLIVSAWNNQISLKFAPAKGKDSNGLTVYATDYQDMISTSLTADNTGALLTGIETEILPAIKDNKSVSVSVTMGSDANRKVLTVKYDKDKDEVSLELVYGVAESGIAAENTKVVFTFASKSYYKNYDSATGNAEEFTVQAPFMTFIAKLKDVYNLSPVVSHTMRYSDALKNSISNGYANQQQNNMGSGTYSTGYEAQTMNIGGIAEMF